MPSGPYSAATCGEDLTYNIYIHTFLITQEHEGPPWVGDLRQSLFEAAQHFRQFTTFTHTIIQTQEVNKDD
mgnify:CR=1 FL=1